MIMGTAEAMAQGKLRVVTRPDGLKMTTLADVSGIHFTGAPLVAKPQLLDDLERAVRAYTKAGK